MQCSGWSVSLVGLPDVQPRVSTLDPSVGVGLQQQKAQGWG